MRPILAVDITPFVNPSNFAPARITSVSSLINVFIPLVLTAASVILLFMLFLGGFKIITAGGSAENFEKAKMLITWAVVGFGIIALAFFIVKVIGYITNVPILL